MSIKVLLFVAYLGLVGGGAYFATFSGYGIAGSDQVENISLRNESRNGATRRSHFYYGTGFYGK